jgi:hypothetical protein
MLSDRAPMSCGHLLTYRLCGSSLRLPEFVTYILPDLRGGSYTEIAISKSLLCVRRDDLPAQTPQPGLEAQPPGQLLDPAIISCDSDQLCTYPHDARAANLCAVERPEANFRRVQRPDKERSEVGAGRIRGRLGASPRRAWRDHRRRDSVTGFDGGGGSPGRSRQPARARDRSRSGATFLRATRQIRSDHGSRGAA